MYESIHADQSIYDTIQALYHLVSIYETISALFQSFQYQDSL